MVGFRHCRLGDQAAEAVADLIKGSRTLVEPWSNAETKIISLKLEGASYQVGHLSRLLVLSVLQ